MDRSPKQLLVLLLVSVLLVAAISLSVVRFQMTDWWRHRPVGESVEDLDDDERRKADQLFQLAQENMREGRFNAAEAQLREIQSIANDYPGLPASFAWVEKEWANEQVLGAARDALEHQQWANAKAELDKVSPDTSMRDQVQHLRRTLRDAVDASLRGVQALIDENELAEARFRVDEALQLFPDHEEAQRLSLKLSSTEP